MKPERHVIYLALLMLVMALPASIGRADTIYMKDGVVRQGRIISENDKEVVLDQNIKGIRAQVHIPKTDIERIERTKEGKGTSGEGFSEENERLAKELDEYYAKARMNDPGKFEYDCEAVPDDQGIFRFRDKGRMWKTHTDLCVSYCEKAMDAGRKRIALLQQFPDTPQFKKDIESTKTLMTQVYAFEVKVLADRARKGRGAEK